MGHKTGAGTSTVVTSPSRRRRRDAELRRQERAWAARSGPVTVKRVDPSTLR